MERPTETWVTAPERLVSTTRREACVKADQPGSGFGFASDGVPGVPCAGGCSITIPLIPQRIAYYRVRYRDSGGNDLTAGEYGIAGESWKVSVSAAPASSGRKTGVSR